MDVGAAISDAVAETGTAKPVLAVILAAEGAPATLRRSAPVPAFAYPEAAAKALGRAAERADWLRRPAGAVPVLDDVDHDAAAGVARRALENVAEAWLGPQETRALVEAYGIPMVAERSASTSDEAVAAAAEIGYPVVVKTAAAGAHKTETGGVALDLNGADEVREAAERIGGP